MFYMTGQVIFFTKQKPESVMNADLILNGEQFASSYGYTMTTLDCNGDGYVSSLYHTLIGITVDKVPLCKLF